MEPSRSTKHDSVFVVTYKKVTLKPLPLMLLGVPSAQCLYLPSPCTGKCLQLTLPMLLYKQLYKSQFGFMSHMASELLDKLSPLAYS
ncbi:hypothetical protein ACA910_009805 [Epithemia clementina (nom. ined.)]